MARADRRRKWRRELADRCLRVQGGCAPGQVGTVAGRGTGTARRAQEPDRVLGKVFAHDAWRAGRRVRCASVLLQFANKASAVETVTPMRDKDGSWKVSGYYVK